MSITKRIRESIEDQGLRVSNVEKDLGLSNSRLQKIFADERPIPSDLIEIILDYLGLNDLQKHEVVFGESKYFKDITNIEEPSENYREIPIVDGEVFGTISPAMSDALALKPEAFARIPQFSKGDYAVQVTGNSMKGVINHGDWIVIKRIINKDFIIYGECYLVITKSDNLRTVKYLNENPDDPDTLWLSPYNKEQFNSQLIPREEILELYSVIGVFRKM